MVEGWARVFGFNDTFGGGYKVEAALIQCLFLGSLSDVDELFL